MGLENSSNCIAALFEAAGAWTAVGSEEQKALGSMTLNEVNAATNTWSHAEYKLGAGNSYSEIPTSFQGSWMSKGQIGYMVWQENMALDKKLSALDARIASDQSEINDGYGSHGFSADQQSALASRKKIYSLEALINSPNAVNDFFNATSALVNGTISAGQLSKFNPGYLHHEITGEATITQLTDHVKQLIKEKAKAPVLQAANALLGQAQAWQEGQTACANAGVKQAQGYLTTSTNEVVAGLNSIRGLVAMLKLSQRELAR